MCDIKCCTFTKITLINLVSKGLLMQIVWGSKSKIIDIYNFFAPRKVQKF